MKKLVNFLMLMMLGILMTVGFGVAVLAQEQTSKKQEVVTMTFTLSPNDVLASTASVHKGIEIVVDKFAEQNAAISILKSILSEVDLAKLKLGMIVEIKAERTNSLSVEKQTTLNNYVIKLKSGTCTCGGWGPLGPESDNMCARLCYQGGVFFVQEADCDHLPTYTPCNS